MAGEIIAVGDEVKNWKKGDRVCANFAPKHLFGDATSESVQSSMGAQSPGILTEYRCFPANVCIYFTP